MQFNDASSYEITVYVFNQGDYGGIPRWTYKIQQGNHCVYTPSDGTEYEASFVTTGTDEQGNQMHARIQHIGKHSLVYVNDSTRQVIKPKPWPWSKNEYETIKSIMAEFEY